MENVFHYAATHLVQSISNNINELLDLDNDDDRSESEILIAAGKLLGKIEVLASLEDDDLITERDVLRQLPEQVTELTIHPYSQNHRAVIAEITVQLNAHRQAIINLRDLETADQIITYQSN